MNNLPDIRRISAHRWATAVLGGDCAIQPLAGDASFRRYFRIKHQRKTLVLMDAPPEKEVLSPFLSIRHWLETAGVRVPHLVAEDITQGFLLLEDFGDMTWTAYLEDHPDPSLLLQDAVRQLGLLQSQAPDFDLAIFDEMRMHNECDLYLDWYLPHVAAYKPSADECRGFHDALSPLLADIAALPHIPVHLDYHSRNLMLPADGLPLGVIDFQDAVMGPATYDLASLLYDCYQDYSEDMRRVWSLRYFELLPHELKTFFTDAAAWHRVLRVTALQRHIKAIGIFSRLAYRDGKRQFLGEIPLTRKHLRDEILALGIKMDKHPLLLKEPAA